MKIDYDTIKDIIANTEYESEQVALLAAGQHAIADFNTMKVSIGQFEKEDSLKAIKLKKQYDLAYKNYERIYRYIANGTLLARPEQISHPDGTTRTLYWISAEEAHNFIFEVIGNAEALSNCNPESMHDYIRRLRTRHSQSLEQPGMNRCLFDDED
ncbi:hypothetical protein [Kistimonas asteriae]|uniref:hypothetical protein n=1 Tax=Kistimonas asteriae TaxID=517724 RepID=UPI001BACD365|nr:hypothetical protein [Kistimonas asteriae]